MFSYDTLERKFIFFARLFFSCPRFSREKGDIAKLNVDATLKTSKTECVRNVSETITVQYDKDHFKEVERKFIKKNGLSISNAFLLNKRPSMLSKLLMTQLRLTDGQYSVCIVESLHLLHIVVSEMFKDRAVS